MLRSGPAYDEHLHFVLSDPADFAGHASQSCILVWATTIYGGNRHDKTCLLDAGCHPFIKHPSYVPFAMAEVRRAADLEKLVQNGSFRAHHPIDAKFVRRLLASMIDSPRTSRLNKCFANQVWASFDAG